MPRWTLFHLLDRGVAEGCGFCSLIRRTIPTAQFDSLRAVDSQAEIFFEADHQHHLDVVLNPSSPKEKKALLTSLRVVIKRSTGDEFVSRRCILLTAQEGNKRGFWVLSLFLMSSADILNR